MTHREAIGEILAEFASLDATLRVAQEGEYEPVSYMPSDAFHRNAGILEGVLSKKDAKTVRTFYNKLEHLRGRIARRLRTQDLVVREEDKLDEVIKALYKAREVLETVR